MLGAMTEPQFGGTEGPLPPQQPQYQPPPPGYPQQPPGYPPPGQYPPAYMDPAAPYGRHPLTGEPLSDKSKTVGGLLQLIGLFGIVGIGPALSRLCRFGDDPTSDWSLRRHHQRHIYMWHWGPNPRHLGNHRRDTDTHRQGS